MHGLIIMLLGRRQERYADATDARVRYLSGKEVVPAIPATRLVRIVLMPDVGATRAGLKYGKNNGNEKL